MNDRLWNILEQPNSHHHIKDDDVCIYAREYVTGYGYQAGPTNRLILNFKKKPSIRIKNPQEWRYRTDAIEVFVRETNQLRGGLLQTVTAIPSSKQKNHPEYDNRFEDFFKSLSKSQPLLSIEWPIEIKKTTRASRCQGDRDSKSIKENYSWKGFKKVPPKELYVFDDVLVSGAHFRAVSDFLKENAYIGKIIGVFWAKGT